MALHDRREAQEELSFGRFAALDRIELSRVARKAGKALGVLRSAFIGDVIGAACERVQRLDRGTERAWNQQRRDGKVFVVIDRHGLASIAAWWGKPELAGQGNGFCG